MDTAGVYSYADTAGALAFAIGYLVALAAFWTTRMMALNQTYFMLMLFFSGQIAPLEVLPPFVQTIASALPFRWIMGFPVELLLGRLTPDQALMGFAAQGVWLLASILCLGFAGE